LVGVAVNVSELPLQLGLEPAVCAIDTAGVTLVVTDIKIEFDVAVVGLAQAALDVITHVTL
jgi:hypothetical protein